jgi:hypothetical protein
MSPAFDAGYDAPAYPHHTRTSPQVTCGYPSGEGIRLDAPSPLPGLHRVGVALASLALEKRASCIRCRVHAS